MICLDHVRGSPKITNATGGAAVKANVMTSDTGLFRA